MSQSVTDSKENKAFENGWTLYLKSYENARNEISTSIKLQYDALKIGLTFLSSVSVLAGHFYSSRHPGHAEFLIAVFLGLGFLACGFMYLLTHGQIRIMRAGAFCKELEDHFQQHPRLTELQQLLQVQGKKPRLWEQFVTDWNEKTFPRISHEITLYAPFLILIVLFDVFALSLALTNCLPQIVSVSVLSKPIQQWLAIWGLAVLLQGILIYSMYKTLTELESLH